MGSDPVLAVVTGALRSCLHDHGPITATTLPSAAKRLSGQLKSHAATVDGDSVWKRKLRDVQHGHKVLLARHERLRARLNAVRRLHAPEYEVCVHCAQSWPCLTIPALDNALAGQGANDTPQPVTVGPE